jgi:hypothetical protein
VLIISERVARPPSVAQTIVAARRFNSQTAQTGMSVLLNRRVKLAGAEIWALFACRLDNYVNRTPSPVYFPVCIANAGLSSGYPTYVLQIKDLSRMRRSGLLFSNTYEHCANSLEAQVRQVGRVLVCNRSVDREWPAQIERPSLQGRVAQRRLYVK